MHLLPSKTISDSGQLLSDSCNWLQEGLSEIIRVTSCKALSVQETQTSALLVAGGKHLLHLYLPSF